MKRHGNLFDRIVSPENLHAGFARAKKGKGWQRTVQAVETHCADRMEQLREELVSGRFQTSPYRVRTIYEPKTRDIYILPFYPDRIVQHAIMNILEPIWTPLFINESYACIPGRGLHAGCRKTMEFVRRFRYFLKCDISKFYPSMVHDILFAIIKRKIKCQRTLDLLGRIIYALPGGKNVPIGNYTSQWKGNLYLNEVDMLVKHRLRIKGYVRYCDDFILFDDSKAVLRDAREVIRGYIGDRLGLTYSRCDIAPVTQGVDFLGYRHFPNKILLRKSTARRVRRRLVRLPELYSKGAITLERYRSSVASTWGWLKWANSYHFRLSVCLQEIQDDIDTICASQAV